MKNVIIISFLMMWICSGGCIAAGILGAQAAVPMAGVMASPTDSEKKIPAEYKLAGQKNAKILVIVEQLGWIKTGDNLRYYLTKAINKSLEENADIDKKNIISYDKLSEYRNREQNYSSLSPAEIGKALHADFVIFVTINDYEFMEQSSDSGCYRGFMTTQAAVFDVKAGEKVWPDSEELKNIPVGFDLDKRGKDIAFARLMAASAYCTTRYLYDCIVNKFRIQEDKTNPAWGDWGK